MKISESLVKEGVVEGTLDKYYDGKSCVLMCQPAGRFTDTVLGLVVDQWKAEIGMKYNFWGCVGIPFKIAKRISKGNRRKCSGHTSAGYAAVNFSFWDKDRAQVSPNDILRFCVYTDGYFTCSPLEKGRKYRPGTIGIVIDDYSLNIIEMAIELFTGDGIYTFNVLGG